MTTTTKRKKPVKAGRTVTIRGATVSLTRMPETGIWCAHQGGDDFEFRPGTTDRWIV